MFEPFSLETFFKTLMYTYSQIILLVVPTPKAEGQNVKLEKIQIMIQLSPNFTIKIAIFI